MTTLEIFKLEKDKETDVLTDTAIWKHYFNEKSRVFHKFGSNMKKMQQIMGIIMEMFANEDIVNFSHAKLERELQVIRDCDKKRAENALKDAKLFGDIAKSLSNYEDDEKEKLKLRNCEQNLKDAKKIFESVRAKTELIKEKYQKKSFEMEKAEIKKELTDKEAEIKKFTDNFESLKQKANDTLMKYKEEFTKFKSSGKTMEEESKKYVTERITVDTKRADFILERLGLYAREAKTRPEDLEEVDLKGVNVEDIVKCRLPRENIEIKKPERYRSTKNKEELIQQMKKELEEERKKSKYEEELDSDENDVVVNIAEKSLSDSCQSKRVGKRFLVTTTYTKQAANELSLSQGKFITMIMPANSKGMAFGEKRGRFGKKSKGFFPVTHVALAE